MLFTLCFDDCCRWLTALLLSNTCMNKPPDVLRTISALQQHLSTTAGRLGLLYRLLDLVKGKPLACTSKPTKARIKRSMPDRPALQQVIPSLMLVRIAVLLGCTATASSG